MEITSDLPSMEIHIRADGQVKVVELNGALDLKSVEQVRLALEEVLASPQQGLLVDLSGVMSLKSSGYQILYDLAEQTSSRKIPVALVGPPDSIAQIMHIFHLDELFQVYPSVDDAINEGAFESAPGN